MNTTIQKTLFKTLIKNFDFRRLFNELGWNNVNMSESLIIGEKTFGLTGIAEKAGFVVFACSPNENGSIPIYDLRRKIDIRLSKLHFEHLIIYTDRNRTQQIWQIVIREFGKPVIPREVTYYVHQEPQLLYQKLSGLFFSLEEEDKIGIVDVHARVVDAFNKNAESVIKRFYDQFKKEREGFVKFIEGIAESADLDWYTSVMLNRLMFIYFIQKKGFLNHDFDYLRNKLKETQVKKGQDQYYSFYRNFLRVLFHQGLGATKHSPELIQEVGQVPYLNGGLFDVHELEKKYPNIQIPDKAFENIFDFFDQWNWHLDTRACATGRDINPDVLGFIYEKYINQKQMGAYYTKEDITGYISQNTVIPCLFDKAREKCKIAFEGEQSVWRLLQNDPDRYIYDAVKKGVEKPLPPEIEIGVDTSQPNLIERRKEWNKPAPEEYALPTEIWREVVARRQRYEEVWQKLVDGAIHEINDLITYNLDIKQFASDVIVNCEGPELLRAFWKAIQEITILDPTVGSGAFLFAALNILESLYEAGLDRMQAFLEELDNSGEKHRADKYGDFRQILAQIEKHPNRRYFIFKSIIVNNLYGVDIMEEAVEICRLRLFLKLVAETDVDYAKPNMGLEPLPDIDFNIKAGNSLVGFATYSEMQKAVQSTLDFGNKMKEIDEKAEACAMAYDLFKKLQIEGETAPGEIARAKADLQNRLARLDDELNRYLAIEYGKKLENKVEYEKWLKSHQPFHWFVEFYGIVHRKGGFDVIIGNPPYVNASKVRKEYNVKGYDNASCPDIYAWVLERVSDLTQNEGYSGMIVPLSLGFSGDFEPCRKLLFTEYGENWFSSFGRIPSALFNFDVRVRNTIHLGRKSKKFKALHTTRLHRWFEAARSPLFQLLEYALFTPELWQNRIPKINTAELSAAIEKCFKHTHATVSTSLYPKQTRHDLHFKKTAYNWLNFCINLPPCYDEVGKLIGHTEFGDIYLSNSELRDFAFLFLNGKIIFDFWGIIGDDFHVTRWMFADFPIDFAKLPEDKIAQLLPMVDELERAMKEATSFKVNAGRKVGNYNLAKCRHVTDRSDKIFAEYLGLDAVWQDIELLYSQIVKTNFDDENE